MSPAREKLSRSSISHCQSPGVQADDRLFKRVSNKFFTSNPTSLYTAITIANKLLTKQNLNVR